MEREVEEFFQNLCLISGLELPAQETEAVAREFWGEGSGRHWFWVQGKWWVTSLDKDSEARHPHSSGTVVSYK